MPRFQIFPFLCICIIAVLYILFPGSFFPSNSSGFYLTTIVKNEDTTLTENLKSFCNLKNYDPWDPEAMQYVNLHYVDKFTCKEFKYLTRVVNQTLYKLSRHHKCRGRCIFRDTDDKNLEGPWRALPAKYECEFMEAQCTLKNSSKVVYNALHSQIVKHSEPAGIKNQNKTSVFVILIDSMSWSQSYRTIPKTMNFFESAMKAVIFPFVNKVGINSKPNGFALWFGKLMEDIDRSMFGLPPTPSDISFNDSCSRYLDNETSIFDEFKKSGYKTLLAEDWAKGMINWPKCKGYQKQPVDHSMQPFLNAFSKNSKIKENYSVKNCGTVVNDMLKYLQQFMDTHKENPKFAFLWTSILSHDYPEHSMRLDTDILEFLIDNRKTLDNSYVFLMGDHGLRYGFITKTKLGMHDVNNPLLSISVPKHLRKTDLVETMKRNARSLQTHFDTRATLLDVLKNDQPLLNSQAKAFKLEYGQSLMRKQHGERSCRTLPIPFEYCICDFEQKEMNVSSSISIKIGSTIISKVNQILKEEKITNKCGLWKFSKVLSISSFNPSESSIAYNVVVAVSEPYKKARFRATVFTTSNGSLKVGTVDRMDSYGYRGQCVRPDAWRLCDCKK